MKGGSEMVSNRHRERLKRCSELMKEAGLKALLLTKPQLPR